MKLSKAAVLLALGATFLGAGLIVACGGDDDTGTTTSKDAGTSATDTGPSTVPDSGGSAVVDSGSTVDAGSDAGDGGLKGLGQACTVNANCESNLCFMGGAGGGANAAGDYCTITCTNPGNADPVCANKPGLTGKCNGKGACQPTTN